MQLYFYGAGSLHVSVGMLNFGWVDVTLLEMQAIAISVCGPWASLESGRTKYHILKLLKYLSLIMYKVL